MQINIQQDKLKNFSLENLIVIIFGFWAIFQNIWINLQISKSFYGTTFSVIVLWLLAIIALVSHPRIKVRSYFIWILFLLYIVMGIVTGKAYRGEAIKDLSVYFCTFLLCSCIEPNLNNKKILIKILIACGVFVSITVLLDQSLNIFRHLLIGIYSEAARNYKLQATTSGGILPNTGAAGCFIVSGLLAYIYQLRLIKQKATIKNWFVILLFAISFVMIKKRGFALDIIFAFIILFLANFIFNPYKSRINVWKILRGILAFIGVVIVFVILYSRVPIIQDAVNNYIIKFLQEDRTLSGRTLLYELAIDLFQNSPFFGIGWARYRTYTQGVFSSAYELTYDAHNVYLQVLCETGIIGLLLFLSALLSSIIPAFTKLKSSIISGNFEDRIIFELGLFFQLFFIFYCFSGNPLYDYSFLVMYFLGIFFTI